MQPEASWQHYLPIVIIVIAMLFRLRGMKRARPMHLGRLLIGPVLLAVLVIYLAVTVPPDLGAAAIFAGAALAGAALGWQRARLMKIVYDPASDTFTLQQSPWAVALLIMVMLARRLLLPSVATMHGGVHAPHATWVIDGLIGFGFGTVVARNFELWLRAKGLRASTLARTFA